jgi:hypothetical protein
LKNIRNAKGGRDYPRECKSAWMLWRIARTRIVTARFVWDVTSAEGSERRREDDKGFIRWNAFDTDTMADNPQDRYVIR